MRAALAFGLVLVCAACGQDSAPAGGRQEEWLVVSDIASASPSEAEEFLTRHTWGLGQGGQAHGPFAPRSTCGGAGDDPSNPFHGTYEFRLALAEAVLERDADALVALASPDIMLDFGGGQGRAEFSKRLTDPDYLLWDELEKVLPLGCAIGSDGGITIPSFFENDLGDYDFFEVMVVMGQDVPLRAQARAGAAVVANLDWELVEINEYPDPALPFAKVKALNGKEGYVATSSLRSIADYRLGAKKGPEGWRITFFVAGD